MAALSASSLSAANPPGRAARRVADGVRQEEGELLDGFIECIARSLPRRGRVPAQGPRSGSAPRVLALTLQLSLPFPLPVVLSRPASQFLCNICMSNYDF